MSMRVAPKPTGLGLAVSVLVTPVHDSDTICVGLTSASLVKVVAPVNVVAPVGVQVTVHVAWPPAPSVIGGSWPPRTNCAGDVVIVLMVRLISPWFSTTIDCGLDVVVIG